MLTIVQGSSEIHKVWGKQKPKTAKYRPLKYLLDADSEDGRLLLNTITGQMVLLNQEEERIMKSSSSDMNPDMQELIEAHFLVPEDYDEHKQVHSLRKILQRMDRRHGLNQVIILPTTSCNARCAYCFERGIEYHTMTPEIALKAVDYIVENRNPAKKLNLQWFGGEPLVASRIIDLISSELTKRGVDFKASMITNGYLFDSELCKKAKEQWKIHTVQITLDGTEENYNRIKAYVNAKDNPYKRVMKNIDDLINAGVYVSIRLNYDQETHDDIVELIHEIKSKDYKPGTYSVYDSPLFQTYTPDEGTYLYEEHSQIHDLIRSLNMHEERLGLVSLRITACQVDFEGSMTINPQGRLLKCAVGADTYFIGDIWNGITDSDSLASVQKIIEWDNCSDCVMMPACMRPEKCKYLGYCNQQKVDSWIKNTRLAMNKRYSLRKAGK